MKSLILQMLAVATPAAGIVFPDANIFAQLPLEKDQVATTVEASWFSSFGLPELPKAPKIPSIGDVVDGIKKPFKHIADILPQTGSFDDVIGKAIKQEQEWEKENLEVEDEEFMYPHGGLQAWMETMKEEELESVSYEPYDQYDEGHGPPHPPPGHGPPGPPGHGQPDHGPPGKHHPKHPSPGHGPPHHHPHKFNETIYELISKSNYTKNFTALIEDDKELVSLLNSTKINSTVFVPSDWAFKKIPKHYPKPPKEVIAAVLRYHILNGTYPGLRLVLGKTSPTLYEPPNLGGPQRISVIWLPFKGLIANLASKIIMPNLFAVNGVIHGVSNILFPPPPTRVIVNLFPGTFSTLSLGLERTGLAPFLNSTAYPHPGGTFFAPTNTAFKLLGPRINAFLFSPYGKKYLKALLEYHVVPNITVYSTALYNGTSTDSVDTDLAVWEFMGKIGEYGKNLQNELDNEMYNIKEVHGCSKSREEEESESRIPIWDDLIHGKKPKHSKHAPHVKFFKLPTLLSNYSLPVVIVRRGPFIFIKANHYGRVIIQDGLASDGVVQVVNRVLIPPHQHRKGQQKLPITEEEFRIIENGEAEFPEDMSVKEFMERMDQYLPVEERMQQSGCAHKVKDEEAVKLEF